MSVWWQATRPFAFPASVIPALLGGLVAVTHAGVRLNVLDYILVAVAAACTHAAANLLNDFFDFRKGVDRANAAGEGRGMLVTGLMTPRAVLTESILLWLVAAGFAVYFVAHSGSVLIPIIAGGLILGAGYTAAPTQLKYRAFGEPAVFLAFGVGITLGSYAVQTGSVSWIPVAYSLPLGFLIMGILLGNNLRDIETDRESSIRTLAMLIGRDRGRLLYAALVVLAYASLLAFAAAGWMSPWTILTLLTLPLALGAVKEVLRRTGTPAALANVDVRTAQLQMVFGLLMILGLVGQAVF